MRAESGRDPVSGKRRQISRTVRGSKRDAEKVLNALVADADRGEDVQPQQIPVAAEGRRAEV